MLCYTVDIMSSAVSRGITVTLKGILLEAPGGHRAHVYMSMPNEKYGDFIMQCARVLFDASGNPYVTPQDEGSDEDPYILMLLTSKAACQVSRRYILPEGCVVVGAGRVCKPKGRHHVISAAVLMVPKNSIIKYNFVGQLPWRVTSQRFIRVHEDGRVEIKILN